MRRGQLEAVGRGQGQVGVAEAAGGRLDRRERAAQVVPDRRQQRAARLGGLGTATGLLGLRRRALAAQRQQRLAAHHLQQAPVGRGQRAAGADEVQVVLHGDVDVGVLRRPAAERARRGDAAPLVARPFQQRHRGEPERLAHLLQQPGQRVGAGEHGARERGEQRRLRARPLGLLRAPGRPVDDQRHQHPDDHHRAERHDVLRLGDRERVQRRGQEEVEQQPAQQRRQERRAEPAHQRRDDRGQEVQDDVGGQRARRPPRPVAATGSTTASAQPSTLRICESDRVQRGQPQAAARLVVGDHVHVDGAGVRRDPGADALDEHPREPGAPRGAEHELGGVGAAGEVEQRGGHVLAADHGVEARADVLGEPPQLRHAPPTGAPASPSPRSTCTASRSAAPERLAIRAARRSTVSLSLPPVSATTTRSRVSQVSVHVLLGAVALQRRRRPRRPPTAAPAPAAR